MAKALLQEKVPSVVANVSVLTEEELEGLSQDQPKPLTEKQKDEE